MPDVIGSIRTELLRYKALAEGAIGQLSDAELSDSRSDAASSVATICWHIAGNLQSRFTDFLTSDGEKPWRHREEEFQPRAVTHAELEAKWALGWNAVLQALDALDAQTLDQTVTIRGQALPVGDALHRALAHCSYHVGQIVYVAKAIRGRDWTYLSIPPGQSDAYNRQPTMEKPADHARVVSRGTER
ncbi:MAG: DUF1572 family protein [Vicinamibacterales bacterium]